MKTGIVALVGWLVVGLTSALADKATGYPLQPDEATLLLAGFEQGGDRADYANGWDRFGGGGYTMVEGYYGQGIDARGVHLPEDFWSANRGPLPHFTQWIFWPRGNVDFQQGTLEFWFRPAPSNEKRVVTGGADLIHFYSYQPLRPRVLDDKTQQGRAASDTLDGSKKNPKMEHVQPYVRLTTQALSWRLVTLKGQVLDGKVDFRKVKDWAQELDPEQWYHFALQWSPDGVAFYLDGRLVGAHRLQDDAGLALTGPTTRGLAINGVVFDELRISDVPRYNGSFEPNWKTSSRPEGAFPGISDVEPVAWKVHAPNRALVRTVEKTSTIQTMPLGDWRLELAGDTGYLQKWATSDWFAVAGTSAAGLLLWEGVERSPLPQPVASSFLPLPHGGTQFSQRWGDFLQVNHALRPGSRGEIVWRMRFHNTGNKPLWLESLLALPTGAATTGFFDMSWEHSDLRYSRRRDDYAFSLPMVAASDGRLSLGVGLNPRQGASALIGEWLPPSSDVAAMIRQGTRLALAPGEIQELEFIILSAAGDFGVKDAVVAYHELFPDLYHLSPEVPIYSYMGVCQHFPYVSIPDLARVYYCGGQWGHGPYHTKGDYLGSSRFWNRTDLADRPDYQHALGNQRTYKTIEALRKEVVKRSRDVFFDFYTPRRSHDVPNLAPLFLVEEIMPGIEFPDDPLYAGQYYLPKNLLVNEYRTPLGYKFMTDQANTIRLIGQYSPGFINDVCYTSGMRFTDRYARQSSGRAFARDIGEYLVATFGYAERYRMVNGFSDSGRQQSMISDGGMISYMLSAWSSANTFESGDPFVFTPGTKIGQQVSRNLLGEKPNSVLTSYGLDNIGLQFSPGDFTPEKLRDYYRYAFRQAMLNALEAGYYADPPLLHGKQWNNEVNPILVESLVRGRKLISGVRADGADWLVRGGDGNQAIVLAGNTSSQAREAKLRMHNRYFEGKFLWVPYFGGTQVQELAGSEIHFEPVRIGPFDIAAWKPVACWDGEDVKNVQASWAGDGLEIQVVIEMETAASGTLRLFKPEVFYAMGKVTVDEKPAEISSDGSLQLPPGRHTIKATLRNDVLRFSSSAWAKVDLLHDGRANFAILAESKPGFERGTASQLNWFLQQYDEEDGIEGNLTDAPIYEAEDKVPANFSGWLLDVRPDPLATVTDVEMDTKAKRICFRGRTPGEVRRGLMVFMRLLDRKYPHIGRQVPLDRTLRTGWRGAGAFGSTDEKEQGWKRLYTRREKTLKFFEDFADKDFLNKPILEKDAEPLYANGNKDFAGRYQLRFAPHLFEPTFTENFIYGYHGPRTQE